MERRDILSAGIIGFGALLLLFLISPVINPSGSFLGLDGSPAVMDHGWTGITGFGYILGDILCHQEASRCFVVNGNQMPICIRDLGLLIGLVAGLVVCRLMEERLSEKGIPLMGLILVAITGIEWLAESFTGDMPMPRFLSGISAGIGAALILGWLLYREK